MNEYEQFFEILEKEEELDLSFDDVKNKIDWDEYMKSTRPIRKRNMLKKLAFACSFILIGALVTTTSALCYNAYLESLFAEGKGGLIETDSYLLKKIKINDIEYSLSSKMVSSSEIDGIYGYIVRVDDIHKFKKEFPNTPYHLFPGTINFQKCEYVPIYTVANKEKTSCLSVYHYSGFYYLYTSN